jgi:alpha-D-ribose 1-methylphosphonate 5-triphosphate synthase subunit PhnH
VALLTLADFETPVYLAPPEAEGAAGDAIRFHAGAPLVTDPGAAMFAVARAESGAALLAHLAVGEDRYPDRSCTLFVEVPAFDGGPRVRLTGPGIERALEIAPAGLDTAFWMAAMDNAARYPLGVDMVLVAGDTIVGLPRSMQLALVEG